MSLHFRGVLLPAGEETDLWVHDGTFTFEAVPGAETVSRRGWLVPGLVDAHCHVGLGPDGVVSTVDGWRQQALADRDAGTLLIRDCGSPVDTRELDTHEDLPRLIRAGRHLAPPRRYLPGVALELEPAELPAAAADQARLGDGWVKLVGDWIDRSVGDLAPAWPADAATMAITAAHDAGARVTAHTFGEDALPALINAGIDCIEHGTGLTEDLMAQMAVRGTALVPTLINVGHFPDFAAAAAAKFPAYAATMLRLHGTAAARVRAAYEAGVAIYAGTDAGVASRTARSRGRCSRCTRRGCLPRTRWERPRGGPGPGWGISVWTRLRRRISACTTGIRASTCRCWRRRRASCCAAESSRKASGRPRPVWRGCAARQWITCLTDRLDRSYERSEWGSLG
ncbi:MAG: amidohydrolase family protein [Geodermatophilaceae bacterium]